MPLLGGLYWLCRFEIGYQRQRGPSRTLYLKTNIIRVLNTSTFLNGGEMFT